MSPSRAVVEQPQLIRPSVRLTFLLVAPPLAPTDVLADKGYLDFARLLPARHDDL